MGEEEPEESGDRKQKKKKDAKLKERAEGEALKKPQSLTEEKDAEGEVKLDAKGSKEAAKAKAMDIPATEGSKENNGQPLICKMSRRNRARHRLWEQVPM